jgi:hypothetical protein
LKYYKPDGTSAIDLFGPMQFASKIMEGAEYMLHPHIVFSMQEALLYVVFREKLAAYHQRQQSD